MRLWNAICALAISATIAGAEFAEAAPATLTEDIDSPIRVHYQKTISVGQHSAGTIFFNFRRVPAHRRLLITNANCLFQMTGANGIQFALLSGGGTDFALPATVLANSNSNVVIASAEVSLLVESGDRAAVGLASSANGLFLGTCTIAGTMIKT